MNTKTESDHICSHRHSFSLDNFFRRLIQPPGRIVGPYIKPGDTVIDIGCGPGFFTISMAEMVGASGRVIAIDLQQEMLAKLKKKILNSPAALNITLHQCNQEGLGLGNDVQAHFILAYYMVHETPNQFFFLTEIHRHLKNGGKMLLVEPPFHVSRKAFDATVLAAENVGLRVIEKPTRKGGMSVLLMKEE